MACSSLRRPCGARFEIRLTWSDRSATSWSASVAPGRVGNPPLHEPQSVRSLSAMKVRVGGRADLAADPRSSLRLLFADGHKPVFADGAHDSIRPMTAHYLATLNPEQRRAVEHGGDNSLPLLIIAGAGSGKTNTLAHRVAHLIVGGADPRRILLLTFSRRAAAEMCRRVERIAANALPGHAALMSDALTWAGTFHAIGARLLREYAEQIGLDRAFTIHDREDSADLVNLVRHDLGFSKTEERFPAKNTCLAIYSRAVNAEAALDEILGNNFPWCVGWEDELKSLFGAYVEAKQRQNVLDYDDLLLYWAQMMQVEEIARDIASRFDHVLVDEYQDTNRLQLRSLLRSNPMARD